MKKMIQCKDCGWEFEYTERQQAEYQKRGFKPPVRCKRCREARRRERSSPYWGIEELVYQPLPARKGCGHQYYLKHM